MTEPAGFTAHLNAVRDVVIDVLLAYGIHPTSDLVDEMSVRVTATIDGMVTMGSHIEDVLPITRGTDVYE
jgi:hypothetical protein